MRAPQRLTVGFLFVATLLSGAAAHLQATPAQRLASLAGAVVPLTALMKSIGMPGALLWASGVLDQAQGMVPPRRAEGEAPTLLESGGGAASKSGNKDLN